MDGGEGFGTLNINAASVNLDLTAIKNVSAMAADGTSRLNSIERINLGADATANTLTLAAQDVNDMAGMNLIRTGSVSADGKTWTNVSGSALSATSKFHQLVVDGTSSDNLILAPSNGFWVNVGTASNGSGTYTVYQNTRMNSQIFVSNGVIVTNNDAISPVILDLNLDNNFTYSQVTMDINSDGQLDKTAWVSSQEGVLIWDKFADGMVHDSSQYAFTQYGGNTDLEALALTFDTNQDGVFDANDEKFSEFAVWQDANQDGISDAGEVRSLSDWGITSINLKSDGVLRTSSEGVIEAGRSSATLANGASMLVADAAFVYTDAQSLAKLTDALTLDLANAQKPLDNTQSDEEKTKDPTETVSDELLEGDDETAVGDETQDSTETVSDELLDGDNETAVGDETSNPTQTASSTPSDSGNATAVGGETSNPTQTASSTPSDSDNATAVGVETSNPTETVSDTQSDGDSHILLSADTQNENETVPSSQNEFNEFVVNPIEPILDLSNVLDSSTQPPQEESVVPLDALLQPPSASETPLMVDGQLLDTPVAPIPSQALYTGLISSLLSEELVNNTTL